MTASLNFANSFCRKLAMSLALTVAASTMAFAQMDSGAGGEMQRKLAALKQSAAANKEKLRHYQWVETRQITLKGEQKPEQVFQCSYGANGQVQRISLGAQPQAQQSGRRGGGALREHIVEKKTKEMKQYMQQVKSLLALYVPPNPQLIQQAIQKKNVSMAKNMTSSGVEAVFKNYAKQGDKMTIGFDPTSRKITSINVDTYMDEPKDAVTLAVQMASLPDGANYAQQSVLDATAKQLKVITINSTYIKLQ
jgi:hypothetical protein